MKICQNTLNWFEPPLQIWISTPLRNLSIFLLFPFLLFCYYSKLSFFPISFSLSPKFQWRFLLSLLTMWYWLTTLVSDSSIVSLSNWVFPSLPSFMGFLLWIFLILSFKKLNARLVKDSEDSKLNWNHIIIIFTSQMALTWDSWEYFVNPVVIYTSLILCFVIAKLQRGYVLFLVLASSSTTIFDSSDCLFPPWLSSLCSFCIFHEVERNWTWELVCEFPFNFQFIERHRSKTNGKSWEKATSKKFWDPRLTLNSSRPWQSEQPGPFVAKLSVSLWWFRPLSCSTSS